MKLHGDSQQERAMYSLIHDTNSELSEFTFTINKLTEWLAMIHSNIKDGKPVVITSAPYIHTEYLKSINKKLKKTIDAYYRQFQNDFPKPE